MEQNPDTRTDRMIQMLYDLRNMAVFGITAPKPEDHLKKIIKMSDSCMDEVLDWKIELSSR